MKLSSRLTMALALAVAVSLLIGCAAPAADPEKTEESRRSGVVKGPGDEGDK